MTLKSRKNKKEYLKDFHKDESGTYVYRGRMYAYQDHGISRSKAFCQLWAGCGATAFALICAGCIPAAGPGSCYYVIFPYALGVVSMFSMLWSMGRLSMGGDPLREYIYLSCADALPFRAALTAVFSLGAMLGELLFLLLQGSSQNLGWSLLFVLLQGAAAAVAFFIRKKFAGLKWAALT